LAEIVLMAGMQPIERTETEDRRHTILPEGRPPLLGATSGTG
jgi:hypothetical protein